MYVLGISCYYHDAAAAIIKDGMLIAAAQEERFTRKKHDQNFPINAVNYCLREAGISGKQLDYVGFYDKPLLKFERILSTYIATFPKSLPSFLKAMPLWIKEKLWIGYLIKKELSYDGPILYTEHHLAHAASAFLVSPFEEAAILTIDGVGEWETATYGTGKGADITLSRRIAFPHSLGLLYSAFTYYLGFRVNSAEFKVMGLAPYGRPVYADRILKELIRLKADGSFKMNMKYFAYDYGLRMTSRKFDVLFGHPPREPESTIEQFHKDVAASIQQVTEVVMVRMATHLHAVTKMKNLCMAGGVALNCVANTRILRETPFENLFVQPAAGDAGGAVGAAYYIYNSVLNHPRNYVWQHAFWGPGYSDEQIRMYLDEMKVPYRSMSPDELMQECARLIAEQNVVGWFQGRMEWGPRALGSRSILADARNPDNQSRVNLKIKFRESFRPFAPSVLTERATEYFEIGVPSPYMLLTSQVRPEKRHIPSVTHVDGSARLQTVNRDDNPLYYELIREFDRQTGCPVIINTSLNVRGEPIVCTPHEAFKCFMRTKMDFLILGSFMVAKKDLVDREGDMRWVEQFELD
ncbi:MAG: carbamoyltransferase [Bacteroidota bacterium]